MKTLDSLNSSVPGTGSQPASSSPTTTRDTSLSGFGNLLIAGGIVSAFLLANKKTRPFGFASAIAVGIAYKILFVRSSVSYRSS